MKYIINVNTLSYTDTGATTNGSKYTYAVRGYKTVSGVNYYSAWSSAKNVKVTK